MTKRKAVLPEKILLTGFEPFGPYKVNSSWEAIRHLDRTALNGAAIRCRKLPVEYERGPLLLEEAVQSETPDVVMSFGVAPGTEVKLERLARNGHRGKADNAGVAPAFPWLERDGEAVRTTSLPLEAMRSALVAAKVPVCYSDDAGGYVCNALFYRLARLGRNHAILCGFIHLPPLGDEFPLSRLQQVVTTAVISCLAGLRPVIPAG